MRRRTPRLNGNDWAWRPERQATAEELAASERAEAEAAANKRRMWWEKAPLVGDLAYAWRQPGGVLKTHMSNYYALTDGIYAVKVIVPFGSGPVKLGVSVELAKRLNGLVTSCPYPLLVLGIATGNRNHEQALHAKLAHLRTKGEWFTDTPEVRQAFLAEIKDRGGVWCATELGG